MRKGFKKSKLSHPRPNNWVKKNIFFNLSEDENITGWRWLRWTLEFFPGWVWWVYSMCPVPDLPVQNTPRDKWDIPGSAIPGETLLAGGRGEGTSSGS